MPTSNPVGKFGTFRSGQTQENARVVQKKELLKIPNRFASCQVDFLSERHLQPPGMGTR